MKSLWILPVAFLSLVPIASLHAAEPPSIFGFTRESAAREFAIESKFDAALSKENLRTWMKEMTARPHHTGSPGDKAVALKIERLFKSWGYETTIEEFEILFPSPKKLRLEMLSPVPYRASFKEPVLAEDHTSGLPGQLPLYHAFSPDGNVTAQLVYVNQGLPRDYELLRKRGVDVRGKIVIARYGGSWRGIKPKVAAENGALACIIYSDPKDDGYVMGDEYPKGPWRNATSGQRGSVADIPLYAGDPLTPFVGAKPDAKRLALDQAKTICPIPVVPITHKDAIEFLKRLDGAVVPEDWRGGLPITYHIGPGPARVHLQTQFDWKRVTIRDVIARMKGSELPDQWVIRGNHHDAWVFGADDPVSGMVSVLEEARSISLLAKTGWKPKRTLIFAAWDAEEQGLIGSTEWVEQHREELQQHAVAYINGDNTAAGLLRMGASHTFEQMLNEIARDVPDPQTSISVGERLRAMLIAGGTTEERKRLREGGSIGVSALGSGSDYSPFLQHAGIASMDLRFRPENSGGVYHSAYDSYDHYSRFMDPTFDYEVAIAKVSGRAVLRLSEADILPFNFTNLTANITKYVREVTRLADSMRIETIEINRQLGEKLQEKIPEPGQTYKAPPMLGPVPAMDFTSLDESARKLADAARQYHASLASIFAGGTLPKGAAATNLGQLLARAEQTLTTTNGLPRRPWYRHQLYAPGYYTGYGVKTLPAVREAIEERKWDEAKAQIPALAAVLDRLAAQITAATALLTP